MIDCDILVTPDIAGLSLRLLKEERAHNAKDGTRNIYIHFRRIYSNETGVARRPHPAVMLLSKQAYWMSGGCDEDFVGNYGKTDPHFKWRASRTNNVAIKHIGKKFSDPLVQMIESDKLAGPRKSDVNNKLFMAKRSGEVAWSTTYLRFPWNRRGEFCMSASS